MFILHVYVYDLYQKSFNRVLDISNSGDDQITKTIRDPTTQLRNLISSLPKLVSLDLSGTNLAGESIKKNTSNQT